MACGTPLLVCFDKSSELADIITRSGSGFVSEPENASELVENIMKLKNSQEMRSSMGRSAREYAEAYASREIATAKYVEIMKSFAKGDGDK
jgi:glycosyltransferase involved in cell wall biosynthesis